MTNGVAQKTWLIEGEKRQKKEKEGRKEEKKRGRKKERRGFYVKGRQQMWWNTATDEGAQRLRSERPVEKKYVLIFWKLITDMY